MAAKPIQVHEKALAHLTRGLYRSPSSAIRELISNAWDAGASRVDITTGVPAFGLLTIRDDGDGMSRDQFERLMTEGIGNSSKRSTSAKVGKGASRPTIGRFGIGMLGVAQICSEFIVASKPRSGQEFAARIRILDFLRDKVDRESLETRPDNGDDQEVFIGTWDWIAESDSGAGWATVSPPEHHGTHLLITQPHPSFSLGFRNTLRPIESAADERRRTSSGESSRRLESSEPPTAEEMRAALPPVAWEDFIDITKKVRRVEMLGDYWSFIWSLAAACPVPYLDSDALPSGLAVREQARLDAYHFTVTVDGRPLRKPVVLRKRERHGYSVQRIAEYSELVFGEKLRFHGYIIVQEGAQITPDELRGILVRVKDVAVGSYDPSLLGYKINQGPRSRWVTGEIFVEEGLEDAVNIDRDSFNVFHPHYKEMQRISHDALGELFTQVYRKLSKRSISAGERLNAARHESLEEAVGAVLGVPTSVHLDRLSEDSRQRDVKVTTRRAEVHGMQPNDLKVKPKNRLLASAILSLYAIADEEANADARRAKFRDLLVQLMRRW